MPRSSRSSSASSTGSRGPTGARFSPLLATVLAIFAVAGCAKRPEEALPRPNLLILSADSLRVDRLAPWSPGGVSTPALRALADRGVLFRDAWAVAPWTAPSMVSVLTGLYPPSHGAVSRDDTTPPELVTLPGLAAAHGYKMGNFSFFSGISYFRNLGLGDPVPDLAEGREPEAFGRWLDQDPDAGAASSAPFFAWIHLLDPHLPYGASGYQATEVQIHGSTGLERAQLAATVPVGSVTFDPGDRERLLELYDQDIVRLDLRVAEVVAVLEDRGLLNDTVIVFVADHGEELLDHGWIGHASTSIHAKLVPEILRIPMLIAGPGVEPGVVRDDLVQQVDILPTLAALLGFLDAGPSDGRDLFSEPGWLSLLLRRGSGGDHVFFDSSVGGNLTPQERRDERLEGASDGRCILTAEIVPGRPPSLSTTALEGFSGCDEVGLARALAQWQRDQATQRLAILRRTSQQGAPSAPEADRYTEEIVVERPLGDAVLTWSETSGQLQLEWQGADTGYWLQYRVGEGVLAVEGMFRVDQHRVSFGPFPEGFWNDLAGYSPFRFRVLDVSSRRRSTWTEFAVAPTRSR